MLVLGLLFFVTLPYGLAGFLRCLKELSSYCRKVVHLKMASLAQRGVAQVGDGLGVAEITSPFVSLCRM